MAYDAHEVLIVELAGQRLGLPGAMVRELLRAVHITPLPRSAQFVEGVISIRGQIVPVLDLRQWLGYPAKAVDLADHLVVVRAGQDEAVLRVDRALELVHLRAAPAESTVVSYAGGLVVLPDLAPLLAHAASVTKEAVPS